MASAMGCLSHSDTTTWHLWPHGGSAEEMDDATKTIGQYWRRKNGRRNSLTLENQAGAVVVIR